MSLYIAHLETAMESEFHYRADQSENEFWSNLWQDWVRRDSIASRLRVAHGTNISSALTASVWKRHQPKWRQRVCGPSSG